MAYVIDPNRYHNSYELNGEDIIWLESNVKHKTAQKLLSYLTSKNFDEDKRPKNEMDLAFAAIEYTKANFNIYKNNPVDINLFEKYIALCPKSETNKCFS